MEQRFPELLTVGIMLVFMIWGNCLDFVSIAGETQHFRNVGILNSGCGVDGWDFVGNCRVKFQFTKLSEFFGTFSRFWAW